MATHQPHHHETAPLHDAPDEWHDHSHDAEQPQHAHSEVGNAHLVVGVGVGAFLLVVGAIIAVYGYYTMFVTRQLALKERLEGNAGERVWTERSRLRDDEPFRTMWIDHDTIQIPLELAVERVVVEYGKK